MCRFNEIFRLLEACSNHICTGATDGTGKNSQSDSKQKINKYPL